MGLPLTARFPVGKPVVPAALTWSLGYFLILTVIVQRYVYIIPKLFIATILLIHR